LLFLNLKSNTDLLQFDSYRDGVKEFFSRIEQGYLAGKPPHIADPNSSGFDIISYEAFKALSASDVQKRLRAKNVIVTRCPHPGLKFDKAGLRTLRPLDSQISIQGEFLMNLVCDYWLKHT
jgi:hypothetical protein